MGMHALKHLVHEIQESLDHGPRHMDVGLPTFFKKHSDRIHKMREEFKQMDRDGAKVANAEAKALGRAKPHDLRKTKKGFKGAGDKDMRDHALDEVLDNVGKALKDLNGKGDLGERIKDAAKELVRGINTPETKLKLLRTYMLALKGGAITTAEQAAATVVANGLYEVYLEGTPAAKALDRKSFGEYVGEAEKFGKKSTKLPGSIDGHTF
jgi:hypothetical protein